MNILQFTQLYANEKIGVVQQIKDPCSLFPGDAIKI